MFSLISNIVVSALDTTRIGTTKITTAAESVMNGITDADYIRALYDNNATRYTSYYESESNNSFTSADIITVAEASGNESHMFGALSSSDTVDYFKITPPRHGRIYVMMLAPNGYSYQFEIYNSNYSVHNYDDYDTTSKSFITTKGSINSTTCPSYYIKVTSNSGYSTSNYRLIIFYALNYENLNWSYPIAEGNSYISSPTGYRTGTYAGYHIGLDLTGDGDESIVSMCSGTIKRAYYDTAYGMGRFVGVLSDDTDEYTNKQYYIRYMHLSSFDDSITQDITSGGTQHISKNATIGILGGSGNSGNNSYGYHLHVEANANSLQSGIDTATNIYYVINIVDVFSNDVTFSGDIY